MHNLVSKVKAQDLWNVHECEGPGTRSIVTVKVIKHLLKFMSVTVETVTELS